MTTNEAIAKYNFISKVLLKNENDELSKELKVKVMAMRIELSKIKKAFDEDSKAFVDELITDDFRTLAQKQDKTEEEQAKYKEEEAKINETYAAYIIQLGNKEVEDNVKLTNDEFNEIVSVNSGNDVNINGNNIPAGDFLEIIYSLFVSE
jgi:hypothetical protein